MLALLVTKLACLSVGKACGFSSLEDSRDNRLHSLTVYLVKKKNKSDFWDMEPKGLIEKQDYIIKSAILLILQEIDRNAPNNGQTMLNCDFLTM